MTRDSKCETCRERKVKCDEVRPACSACMRKNRPCHYKIKKPLVNVNIGEQLLPIRDEQPSGGCHTPSSRSTTPASLPETHQNEIPDADSMRLKYARRTNEGQGLFLTFGRVRALQGKRNHGTTEITRTPSPQYPILSQRNKQAAQWGTIIGYESIDLNPLGQWLQLAWSVAAEDTNIKLACEYTVSSMISFQQRNQEALSRAYAAGARAIESLQTAVKATPNREGIHNLILAVLLHCAGEHFIKLGSFNYVSHFLAAGELLKLYQSLGGSERLFQVTAGSCCADEMMEAIMDGRNSSTFEDTCRPPNGASLEGPCDIDVAMEAVQYTLTRLPRLVFQARERMENPTETTTHPDLIESIVALFNHDGTSFVERTLSAHSTVVRNADGVSTSPMGGSLEFDSVRAFYLAVWHNFSQVVLCSLMQRLNEEDAVGTAMLNIPCARVRDIAAASSLAMCVDYTSKPTHSSPFTALALLGPLQLSSGTWFRVQRRQSSAQTPEYLHAVNMVDWSLTKAHTIEDIWQSAPASVERMTVITDMFAGGPFIPKRGLS